MTFARCQGPKVRHGSIIGWQPHAQRSPERSRMGWGWQSSESSATIPKSFGFEAATRYGASNQCYPEYDLFEPCQFFLQLMNREPGTLNHANKCRNIGKWWTKTKERYCEKMGSMGKRRAGSVVLLLTSGEKRGNMGNIENLGFL